MLSHSRFFQYVRTREGRFSFLLVAACGLALAFFIGRTFFDPTPNLYPLNFGTAQWIEASKPSQSNYFRKTLYISDAVDRAWIQIAATDNYSLYVNDVLLGERNFYSTSVAGLYDLKKVLKPGKNVVAVHVDRYSFPGSGQVLVHGFYAEAGSPLHEFCSDPMWKVSNTPDGIVGGYSWRAPVLDDSFWPYAIEAPPGERFPVIESVSFDPRLIETQPTAKWIAPREGSARQASFSCSLKLPSRRHETWLQIAATGDCDLLINGRLVATQPSAPQPALLAYNVTRWLFSGENSVLIRVHSQTDPAMLLSEGYTVLADGTLERFATDGSWNALLYAETKEPALVVGAYGNQPWGELLQRLAEPAETPTHDFQLVLTWSLLIVAVTGAMLSLWVLVSALSSVANHHPAERLWNYDALFHLCVLALILLFWLLSFDVRFQTNWCFKPRFVSGFILILLVGKLLLFFPRKSSQASAETSGKPPKAGWLRRYWKIVALVCIVLLGFGLRVHNFTAMSLDVDEMGVIQFSKGVVKKGYPFIELGSFEKQVTTYELVSYSIAASRLFLGETEIAFRTPSLIYGTLTIALMGLVGYRMMGWRVGLVSAFIFALFPTAIFWGRNAFWPSQELIFALLTIWCFYEAIRSGPLRPGFLTASAAGFILSYLTWEGAGFLVPALFVCMFAIKWGEYAWIKDWHLWRCFVVMTFVVAIQLIHRQVASMPTYLQTGISLADVSTPEPVWLDLTKYNPDYYFNNCLFAENYWIMTAITLLGIAFCWRDRAIRYLFVVIVALLACYTEFLPAYAVRYSYNYQAVLILVSVGIMFKLWDKIISIGDYKLKWCGATAIFALFVLSTNGFVLKTYRLSRTPSAPFYAERMGIYRTDYRGAARFVAEQLRRGDGLVVAIPHIFEYYTNLHVDYSINTMLDKKITYSGALSVPHFLDKFRGYPCVRSLEELEDLRDRYNRLWIVQVPLGPSDTQNPAVVQYLAKNARTAFESYKAQVNLLIGERNVQQN